ncbi:hypothetical protein BDR26DRAFT_947795 [Obelidium mucronatum]|nr:hypothetical protein BDR26DRAFT_947795 [Obelidium mucronatum]
MSIVQVSLNASMKSSTNFFGWAPLQNSPAPAMPEWTTYFKQFVGKVVVPTEDIKSCTGSFTNVWGASFDDGPSSATATVLKYFGNVNMKATFWVIGSNIQDYPDVLRETYQAGHEIGIHTWSHADLVTLSDDQVISELVYGAKAIHQVLGVVLPFSGHHVRNGSIDDRVRGLAALVGLSAVTWAVDSEDWRYVGTGNMDQVPRAFQSWMDQGVTMPISLEHDLFLETATVVGENLDILIRNGRVVKPLSECIGVAAYENPILESFFNSGIFF